MKSDCLKRADPGPCAAFRQFYGYDEQTDTCKEFHFGGCRGNRNKEWIKRLHDLKTLLNSAINLQKLSFFIEYEKLFVKKIMATAQFEI